MRLVVLLATTLIGCGGAAEAADGKWTPTTPYSLLKTLVTNDGGKTYVLLQVGTSAKTGGPTGTAPRGIADGGCVWGYVESSSRAGSIKHYTVSIPSGGSAGEVLFPASEPGDLYGVSITMASAWGGLVAGNAEFGSLQRFPDKVTFSIRTPIPAGQTAFYDVVISSAPRP